VIHLIYTRFDRRSHYWTTCGWSDSARNARRYTKSDALTALARMKADGVQATIATLD
jgi:hypothetical protein